MTTAGKWRSCTSCRKDIGYDTDYIECSVSTCNRKRNPRFFCSMACWDAHLPYANHRDPWAEDKRSPKS